jgi:glycerophosphoryl diester phosphodiesterase
VELLRREGPVIRVGHRGAPLAAPENSLEAIAAAADQGVDAVEIDLVQTGGGHVLLGHSLAELQAVAPALDDALDLVRERGIGVQLDVKMPGCEASVAAAIRRHGLGDRALASSFAPRILRSLAAADPGLRRALTYPRDRLGVGEQRAAQPLVAPALTALRRTLPLRLPRRLRAVGASAATLHASVVSAAVVRRCHALGIAVWVWTVDDPRAAEALDRLGADAIISNDPGIFARYDGPPKT